MCRSDAILESGQPSEFELEYDTLVMAIGEQPATFGVRGVQEHCFFMKVPHVSLVHRCGSMVAFVETPDAVCGIPGMPTASPTPAMY